MTQITRGGFCLPWRVASFLASAELEPNLTQQRKGRISRDCWQNKCLGREALRASCRLELIIDQCRTFYRFCRSLQRHVLALGQVLGFGFTAFRKDGNNGSGAQDGKAKNARVIVVFSFALKGGRSRVQLAGTISTLILACYSATDPPDTLILAAWAF